MPRYNFISLSSQDFEELVRDLLQAEWNIALEAFKSGRDQGIDLRYSPADGGQVIIQCKHYAGSGFSKLLSHLASTELKKIERLRPARYIVVTSVALSPGNKDEIVRALHPFVINVNDVVGAGDLEGLLSRHPAVERANFKLWLTSTSVIERVLHNAEICHTEFEIARIQRKVPLFVQSDAFPRAMRLLDESRVAVISGAPGIGKSTLAEMLLYTHLEQGYEPVVIQADIAEGKKFFRPDARRIFYYDDFLGQFFLGDRGEYFGRNQDMAVVDFIEMVRNSSHSRFVLTTREHLLQSALLLSERLARSSILGDRCILELRDYNYAHKARILYNHLYFSGLPQAYKDAMLVDDFFLKVIGHQHFSPRLIEWLSTGLREREVPADEYRKYVSSLLQSPHEIWMHAFRNQLSNAARHMLLIFYTLGEYIDTVDLEPAFRAFHRHRAGKYNQEINPGDFRNALQELDGAFLSCRSGHASYLNPSIREFVASVVSDDRDTVDDILVSASRFKQIVNLCRLADARPASALARFLSENRLALRTSLARLLYGPSMRWEKSTTGLRGYFVDTGEESRIEFLAEMAESQESTELCQLVRDASVRLIAHWSGHVPDFSAVHRLLQGIAEQTWFLKNGGGHEIYLNLLHGMLEHIRFASAADWLQLLALPDEAVAWTAEDQSRLDVNFKVYCGSGIDEDRRNCSTVDEMSELVDSLTELGKRTGKDFSDDIEGLSESIAEREERRSAPTRGGNIPTTKEISSVAPIMTDNDARQMFSTLRDKSSEE
jgi:Restriction endonuclease